MNKSLLVYIILLVSLGCSSPSSENYSASEIGNIIVVFSNIEASDDDWNDAENEEITPSVKSMEVERDAISYCYDTQEIVKIEVYGTIYNTTIEFISIGGRKSIITKNQDIQGEFTIVPLGSNDYLQGGSLLIKSGSEILKEIKIIAEGCL